MSNTENEKKIEDRKTFSFSWQKIIGYVAKKKWALPLCSVLLLICLYSPIRACLYERSWFAPSAGQMILPIAILFLFISTIGLGIGLLIERYEDVLKKKQMLIFGILIGAAVCSFLQNVGYLLTTVILIVLVVELVPKDRSFSDIYADLLMGISLALIVQLCFMDAKLPLMNSSIEWDDSSLQSEFSIDLWSICIITPFALRKLFGEKLENRLHIFLGSAASGAALVMTVILLFGVGVPESGQWYTTKEGEYELSADENIIIFVVDQLDEKAVEEYINGNSESREKLADFTLFSNMVAPTSTSNWNIPALLTGDVYNGIDDENEFFSYSYNGNTILKDLKKNGYDVEIYSDSEHLADEAKITAPNEIDNLIFEPSRKILSYSNFLGDIFKLTGYYAAPYKIKKFFAFDTDKSIDNLPINDKSIYTEGYEQFQNGLEAYGLSRDEQNKQFKVYYLNGVSIYADEEDEEQYTEMLAELNECFSTISQYIEATKKQAVYENSTIIIMGGEGTQQLKQNPAVLVKMKGVQNDFYVYDAPMTFDNLRATIMSGLETDSSNGEDLFSTKPIDERIAREVIVEEGVRNTYYSEQERISQASRVIIGGDAADESLFYEAPIPGVYEYTLGQEIKFYGEYATYEFDASGLSDIEPALRWTVGTGAAMDFHIEEAFNDLKVNIYFNNVYQWPQRVVFFANGRFVHEQTLDTWCDIEFTVPHEYVEDGDLEIVMGLPDSVIPTVDGVVVDSRRLGISLDTIVINSVGEDA